MEVLVSLIEADPTADAKKLFARWSVIIRDDDDLLTAALQHSFTNAFAALEAPRRHASRPFAPLVTRAERAASVATTSKVVTQIMLMNLTLPSGKLLREATFKECTEAGGWWVKVGKQGKPNQIVGRTISEVDLRAIQAS